MTYFDEILENKSDFGAYLYHFESVYDNDPYLCKFSFTEESNKEKKIEYKTTFDGILTNLENPLKCTLTEFKSIFENDNYLSTFKESKKESIDEFLM